LDTISVNYWTINAVYCWTLWVSSNKLAELRTAILVKGVLQIGQVYLRANNLSELDIYYNTPNLL